MTLSRSLGYNLFVVRRKKRHGMTAAACALLFFSSGCGEKPAPRSLGLLDTGGDSDAVVFDCSTVPDAPLSVEQVAGAIGARDVAFDDTGYLTGSDMTTIFRTKHDGTSTLFVANVAADTGMHYLSNGDLVAAEGSVLRKITPDGVSTQLTSASGAYLYGVTVGPDGMLYVTYGGPGSGGDVRRIDPVEDTGETIVSGLFARLVDFTPDHSRMIIGAMGGRVYTVELDGNLDPEGEPELLATIEGNEEMDMGGFGVDICGNIYVSDHDTMKLHRITPDGDVSVLHEWTEQSYGHGLEWGSGVGGWDDESIYLPQPYGGFGVVRIEIGVPHSY